MTVKAFVLARVLLWTAAPLLLPSFLVLELRTLHTIRYAGNTALTANMVKSHHHQYAFNFGLVAVNAPDKDQHVLLRVHRWTQPPAPALPPPRVVDQAPLSEAELDLKLNTADTDLALWVGMRPASASYLRAQKPAKVLPESGVLAEDVAAARPPRGKSVDTLASLKDIPVWKDEPGCARVVVKFANRESLVYYELRNRDSKTGVSPLISMQ